MSGFSERIKKFEKIRDYMRDFYVYGFRTRTAFSNPKSLRSYDNERRRIESYLGDFLSFRQNEKGKIVFMSADSTDIEHNPFYKAFKAKSFTKIDITLHFILPDILSVGEAFSLTEIVEKMEAYLSDFEQPMIIDPATVRNKLREYTVQGMILSEKKGRTMYYRLDGQEVDLSAMREAILFFSEADPLGVIGSFLLDWESRGRSVQTPFSFKHHYIVHALESEIFCQVMQAISEEKMIEIRIIDRRKRELSERVVPLRVMVNLQGGRRYLSAYNLRERHILNYRLDSIQAISSFEPYEEIDLLQEEFERLRRYAWGVSFGNGTWTESVEMLLSIPPKEYYVADRIRREGRHGELTKLDEQTYRYFIEVWDSQEMLPWLRTFIGRIEQIHFSNERVEKRFHEDILLMYRRYEEEER